MIWTIKMGIWNIRALFFRVFAADFLLEHGPVVS